LSSLFSFFNHSATHQIYTLSLHDALPIYADLYVVPYNGKAGGAATPVSGAASSGVWEYYPEFSPDDRFIAFNRVEDYTAVPDPRSEEHTSELQSRENLVCRLLLEKKKNKN